MQNCSVKKWLKRRLPSLRDSLFRAFVLATLINLVIIFANYESNNDHQQYRDAEYSSPESKRKTPEPIWERVISDPTALVTLWLFGATCVLVIVTTGLWWSTGALVEGAEDTARRQLRAYLSVHPAKLLKFTPNENMIFSFEIKNHGQTPAYSCTHTSDIIFERHPLPEKFNFPILDSTPKSKVTVHKDIPITGNIVATKKFTQQQLVEALQAPATGGKRIIIFGKIDYKDAFGGDRWTNFCFSFAGQHDWIRFANGSEWERINTINESAKIPLIFEASTQHNETDDG
jgi:hypothetical protein